MPTITDAKGAGNSAAKLTPGTPKMQSALDHQNPSFLSPAPSPSPAQAAQVIQKSGRGIATTAIKNLYRIQTEENKILEPDDI